MTAVAIAELLRDLCRVRGFSEARLFFHVGNSGHSVQLVLYVWTFGGKRHEAQLIVDYADCEKDYILSAYLENMAETAATWRS